MEQLNFDSGIREFSINGRAVLRFNPADPNVYARYIEAVDKISKVEKDLGKKANAIDPNAGDSYQKQLFLMRDADKKVKVILSETFGEGNDFEQIFDGVNVMAVAVNGERVIVNFINMIGPIIEAGATDFVEKQVSETKLNREQRRAMKK